MRYLFLILERVETYHYRKFYFHGIALYRKKETLEQTLYEKLMYSGYQIVES